MKKFFYSFLVAGSSQLFAMVPQNHLPTEQIDKFAQAFSLIQESYIDEISSEQLMEYALEGLLENLDPHSVYLSRQALEDLTDHTEGSFAGLGIEISYESGQLTIISPIDSSPAAKAGLIAGDRITSINGTLVDKISLKDAVNMMKGEPGTTVQIQVMRQEEKNPINFEIERQVISVPSAQGKILNSWCGYVRLSSFTEKAFPEVREHITEFSQNPEIKGIIFDLRNNPGGLLRAASEISNIFLDEQTAKNSRIVSIKGREGSKEFIEEISGKDLSGNLPLVILVNSGSASASEVVAGALQDHRRALIIGQPTFGKGSVQTVLPIGDSAIKLTTAKYYTPLGRSIQATGIKPDVVLNNHWKKVEQDSSSFSYKEKNLAGHLKNEHAAEDLHVKDQDSLLEEDYMLKQAFQTLKIMRLS